MGMADNQKTLSEAQDYANQVLCSCRRYSNKPHGQYCNCSSRVF